MIHCLTSVHFYVTTICFLYIFALRNVYKNSFDWRILLSAYVIAISLNYLNYGNFACLTIIDSFYDVGLALLFYKMIEAIYRYLMKKDL